MKMRTVVFVLMLLVRIADPAQAGTAILKIATWNLEWFMKPETVRALTPACTSQACETYAAETCVFDGGCV